MAICRPKLEATKWPKHCSIFQGDGESQRDMLEIHPAIQSIHIQEVQVLFPGPSLYEIVLLEKCNILIFIFIRFK